MKTRLMEVELNDVTRDKSLSEFDPTPSYSEETLRSIWVWGSIRRFKDVIQRRLTYVTPRVP